MNQFFLWVVRGYQLAISPLCRLLGAQCRFYPSCSQYACDALRQLPWATALRFIGWRLLRCHPWCEGGIDLVPARRICKSVSTEVSNEI
ncbi:MAG: membrane protein insertion efficiency factor YidD [Deltaproteobacteria bacterium]|nr:membrane protein insertion efficiency factor YidD [Deltaproteobacteria bacterium]